MKKPELEQLLDDLWEKIVGYIPKKYQKFPKKLFTYQEFNHAVKILTPLGEKILEARKLVSEELWSYYTLNEITGLPEQRILNDAVEVFSKTLKEIWYEPAKKEPQKASKRVSVAKQKPRVRVPKGSDVRVPENAGQ